MKILGSEITPYKTYLNRRKFIKGSLASAMLATVTSSAFANHDSDLSIYTKNLNENDKLNSYEEITTYNNFYEFGTCLLYTSPSPRDVRSSRMPSAA